MPYPPRGTRPIAGAWSIEPPNSPDPNDTALPPVLPAEVRPTRAPNALKDLPYIGHTGPIGQFVPVYAPIRDGIAYLQDGDYGSAAVSGLEAGLDIASLASGIGAARLAQDAIEGGLRVGADLTYNQARRDLKKVGLIKTGDEMHHIIPRNGMGKSVPSWKNHPALLKSLPQETHQRLTRSWNGKPRFGPLEQLWHGTNAWMKAGAIGGAAGVSRSLPRTDVNRGDPD